MSESSAPTNKDSRICHQCGYDLRGLAHDDCPECGTKYESGARRKRTARDWYISAATVLAGAYLLPGFMLLSSLQVIAARGIDVEDALLFVITPLIGLFWYFDLDAPIALWIGTPLLLLLSVLLGVRGWRWRIAIALLLAGLSGFGSFFVVMLLAGPRC